MDVLWLQDFLTVAETRNFTRAAELRHISQAAFSRRIQNLEEWVGTPLIDRSTFPTRLTADGELFRERAAEILQQVTDARLDLAAASPRRRKQVRIALPHALATGWLPSWWELWSRAGKVDATCSAAAGNVHDTVTAFVSGNADMLVCFHAPQQPIHLSSGQYERIVLGKELFRPYVAAGAARQIKARLPGSRKAPLPLLSYSPGAYLGRMVDVVLESVQPAPVMRSVFESDMADVLREMAVRGLGIAWLPDCSARGAASGALVDIDPGGWNLSLAVVAYRDRQSRNAAVERVWRALARAGAPKKLGSAVAM